MNTRRTAVTKRHTYSQLEYATFFTLMVETGNRSRRAADLYRQRNPDKARYPGFRVFDGVCDRMNFNGNVVPARDQAGNAGGILTPSLSLFLSHY